MSILDSIRSTCSNIGNAISETFSKISSACSTVIDSVAMHAPAIQGTLRALALVIPHPYLKTAIKVVDIVCTVAGLLATGETTENLGEKILQAQEANITPSDFPSYDDYIQEVRNFKPDPERASDFSFGEKVAAGVSVLAWGLEEKFGEHSSDLLSMIIKDSENVMNGDGYFNEARVEAILKSIEDIGEVVGYFKNTLDPDTKNAVEKKLVDVEKSINPEASIADIYSELDKQLQA